MNKEAYYFSHDSNARNDEKLLAVRMKHGWEGYGLFWAIIEKMRESSDYVLSKDYNLLAFDLRVSSDKIKSIIEEFGLFELTESGKGFYSNRLLDSMNKREEITQKRRESGRIGGLKKNEANAKQVPSKPEARKGKEIKGKESKEGDTPENPIPDLEEVKTFFKENGYSEESAAKAYSYYNQSIEGTKKRNWRDSKGNIIKNWKMKMRAVWFKKEHKQQSKKVILYS